MGFFKPEIIHFYRITHVNAPVEYEIKAKVECDQPIYVYNGFEVLTLSNADGRMEVALKFEENSSSPDAAAIFEKTFQFNETPSMPAEVEVLVNVTSAAEVTTTKDKVIVKTINSHPIDRPIAN